jgi:hypothetical protein
MQALRGRFGPGIVTKELKWIQAVLCTKIPDLKADRDSTRDGRVLVKWFEENWTAISPVLQYIQLLDENEESITPARYERNEPPSQYLFCWLFLASHRSV